MTEKDNGVLSSSDEGLGLYLSSSRNRYSWPSNAIPSAISTSLTTLSRPRGDDAATSDDDRHSIASSSSIGLLRSLSPASMLGVTGTAAGSSLRSRLSPGAFASGYQSPFRPASPYRNSPVPIPSPPLSSSPVSELSGDDTDYVSMREYTKHLHKIRGKIRFSHLHPHFRFRILLFS